MIPGVKKVKECRGQDVGWIIRGNVEVKNDGKHGLEEEGKEPGAGGREVSGDNTSCTLTSY